MIKRLLPVIAASIALISTGPAFASGWYQLIVNEYGYPLSGEPISFDPMSGHLVYDIYTDFGTVTCSGMGFSSYQFVNYNSVSCQANTQTIGSGLWGQFASCYYNVDIGLYHDPFYYLRDATLELPYCPEW